VIKKIAQSKLSPKLVTLIGVKKAKAVFQLSERLMFKKAAQLSTV
jgi:hypothetical protein